jgi:hypothetical protein
MALMSTLFKEILEIIIYCFENMLYLRTNSAISIIARIPYAMKMST